MGTGRKIPVGKLALLVPRFVGCEPHVEPLPASSGDHARRRPGATPKLQSMGIRMFASLEEGLQRCIDWYLPADQARNYQV